MTSYNPNFCSIWPGAPFAEHVLGDPDADGNQYCIHHGCPYGVIVCTCNVEPDWTRIIGRATHSPDPRARDGTRGDGRSSSNRNRFYTQLDEERIARRTGEQR